MGNLISTIKRVNNVLKKEKVSSVDELAEKVGLSRWHLYKLHARGLIILPRSRRRRGKPLDTYGPIAENLGVLEMLAYWGFPATIIAEEIGVTKAAVWGYIKNHSDLYNFWINERENNNGKVADNLGVFEMLSYMGFPRKAIARELGVKPESLYYHYRNDPELYEVWKRERWKNMKLERENWRD